MNLKHHQACISKHNENLNREVYNKATSHIYVYDTNFTYPSDGMLYYVFDDKRTSGTYEAPSYAIPTSKSKRSSGSVGNCIFDWNGGGPEGVTSDRWQVLMQGLVWGVQPSGATSLSPV